jgi:hypothetical protein
MTASFTRAKKIPSWSQIQRQILKEKPKQQSEAQMMQALKSWLGSGEK